MISTQYIRTQYVRTTQYISIYETTTIIFHSFMNSFFTKYLPILAQQFYFLGINEMRIFFFECKHRRKLIGMKIFIPNIFKPFTLIKSFHCS